MKSCRAASVVATGTLVTLAALGALASCREAARPEIAPPVTTARPDGAPVLSTSSGAAAAKDAGVALEDAGARDAR